MRPGTAGSFLLHAAVLVLGAGCVFDRPVISPRFGELAPSRIAVMPVENRTLVDLTRVTTAGLVQRLFSAREVNVPQVMQGALAEGLEKKGYQVRSMEASEGERDYRIPVGGDPPGFDAALYLEITDWRRESPSTGGDLSISGTAELVRVGDAAHDGGEVLFQGRFAHRTSRLHEGVRTSADLEEEAVRAARGAIGDLPPAGKAAPPAPGAGRAPAGGAPPAGTASPPPGVPRS